LSLFGHFNTVTTLDLLDLTYCRGDAEARVSSLHVDLQRDEEPLECSYSSLARRWIWM